jgi:hypothetical protein
MITVDMNKAKEIAHEVRREERAKEFAPLDIKATIPAEAEAAESARVAIRTKYETMQSDIDAAPDTDTLKTILKLEADND